MLSGVSWVDADGDGLRDVEFVVEDNAGEDVGDEDVEHGADQR